MKNKIYTFIIALFALPVLANAATFTFSPASATLVPGQTLSVKVYAAPAAGEKIYTSKLASTFPANLASVISFTQASNWMSLVQPGYDALDNTNGSLIKTAGYAGGLTESKLFGTFVFKAKKAGVIKFNVTNDSLMLDQSNANKFTGSNGGNYVAKSPAHVVKTKETTKVAPVVTKTTKEEVTKKETATTSTTTEEVSATTSDQTAAAADAIKGNKTPYYWLIALIILILSGFGYKRWKSAQN